jgi:predicted amidophosphoribosyltransferase
MNLPRLEFGSLLSYAPRGDSPGIRHSRDVMYALKKDGFVGDPPILMSRWVAQTIQQNRTTLQFASFFQPNTTLVPTPKSSLMQPNTLWVPMRIATALVGMGLGKEVAPYLIRDKPVRKAALSMPNERPTTIEHYESMTVQERLSRPAEILLVDDVVTRGATLLGAANRLAEVFPQTRIRAFAAMRTISNPDEFDKVYVPCVGTIELLESGETLRRP